MDNFERISQDFLNKADKVLVCIHKRGSYPERIQIGMVHKRFLFSNDECLNGCHEIANPLGFKYTWSISGALIEDKLTFSPIDAKAYRITILMDALDLFKAQNIIL